MKIQILRDSKGKVIATFERTPGALISMEADVGKSEELVEVDVPDEYIKMSAPDFVKRLQTDIKAKRLKMGPKRK